MLELARYAANEDVGGAAAVNASCLVICSWRSSLIGNKGAGVSEPLTVDTP
jgi:hypothetical protein